MFMTLFNIVFTGLPPFAIGLFEQDVPMAMLQRYPPAYDALKRSPIFTNRNFLVWVISSFYHSLVLYGLAQGIFLIEVLDRDGLEFDMWGFGEMMFAGIIVVLNLKFLIETSHWTWFSVWFSGLGIAGLFLVCGVYSELYTYAPYMYKIFEHVYGLNVMWLYVALAVVAALMFDVTRIYCERQFWPSSVHILQERVHLKLVPQSSQSRLTATGGKSGGGRAGRSGTYGRMVPSEHGRSRAFSGGGGGGGAGIGLSLRSAGGGGASPPPSGLR